MNITCTPCEVGMSPLKTEKAQELLKELGNEWTLNSEGHLFKSYSFKTFMEALEFANKVGEIAEKEGHHPNLTVSWGLCTVEIWTHKINGLTESDFILAAKIGVVSP